MVPQTNGLAACSKVPLTMTRDWLAAPSSEPPGSWAIVSRMPRRPRTLALTLGLTVAMMFGATAVSAQVDTRAEVLARQRAEKATQLQAYKPAKIEKALLFVENSRIVKRLSPRNG